MPGKVLIVEGGTATATILRDAGYEVAEVASSDRAAERLMEDDAPDLVMIETRPATFNGLPLLRQPHALPRIATLVVAPASDPLIEAEAKRHQVKFVVKSGNPRDLLAAVSFEMGTAHRLRRWPRWPTFEGLGARVGDNLAVVLDVSYEGLRFEMPAPAPDDLTRPVEVQLMDSDMVMSALPVWVRRAASGAVCCGAKLLESDPGHVHEWRTTVNAVAQPA